MDPDWRARIVRFHAPGSPLRTVLTLAAAFLAASFVVIVLDAFVGQILLDMDGHSAADEPVRAFLYQSGREFFIAVFGWPHELGAAVGGFLGVVVTLASLAAVPLAFGIAGTALLEWRRRVHGGVGTAELAGDCGAD